MSRRRDRFRAELRALARSGQKDELLRRLREQLLQDPTHPYVLAEMQRLREGRPLLAETDREEERLAAALQEDLAALEARIAALPKLPNAELYRCCRRAARGAKLKHYFREGNERAALLRWRQELGRERRKRLRPLLRRLAAAGAGAVLLAVAAAAAGMLHGRAERAAGAMGAAYNSGLVREEKAALSNGDSGLNRLFSRRVTYEAARLKGRLQAQEQRLFELQTLLDEIEAGHRRVAELSLEQRAAVTRTLREHAGLCAPQQKRWESVCAREAEALQQSKAAVLARLAEPLPPLPDWVGEVQQDEALLQSALLQLRQRQDFFEEAQAAYELSDDLAAPLLQRREALQERLQEVRQYRRLALLLPSQHSYDSYRELLGGAAFRLYPPGAALLQLRDELPSRDTLRGLMETHSHKLAAEIRDAACRTLAEGTPTFSKENPATPEQVHLMDELFTNTLLQTAFYEMRSAENEFMLTETAPEVKNGFVCFRRSARDPYKAVADPAAILWEKPEQVLKRRIDTRPLAEAAQLQREHFFRNAHLPQLLTTLLNAPAPCAPALSRAYIFRHLLQLLDTMQEPELAGLRFCPTLAAHKADFEEMAAHLGIELSGDCWLRRGAEYAAAEERCQAWFREHAGADYAAEIRKNLDRLRRVRPRFCGYAGADGSPVWCREPQDKTPVWLLTEEGLMPHRKGEPLPPDTKSFSPLFYAERY